MKLISIKTLLIPWFNFIGFKIFELTKELKEKEYV